jgi:type II secretory pathway pseudopilin PulG
MQTFRQDRQRGITLIGLLMWGIVVGFGAYIVIRVVPTFTEYSTILRTVQKVAQSSPGSVSEARTAFNRMMETQLGASAVEGKDLDITKENDRVVIRFAYDKEIPLFEPVFLLIKYEGEGRAN